MLLYATLNQMAFLALLVAAGYILAKFRIVPDGSERVLSKLETVIFVPALVLGTFMANFTAEKLAAAWKLMAGSLALELIVIPLALLSARLCAKDHYTRNIYLYGLCFSNFGFMGNAIVSVLFPDIFLEYIIFTLVLWILIYLWGVPGLLMGNDGRPQNLLSRLKVFLNPMFIGMLIGMGIGISGIALPPFADTLVTATGGCMSPVAMLLTGMTIARIDIRAVLKIKSIYVVTALRLLAFPLAFIAVWKLTGGLFPEAFTVCALCSLAMPLGLNTIVIPGAYGKDTTVASGMALVSHILSCVTIPVLFLFL